MQSPYARVLARASNYIAVVPEQYAPKERQTRNKGPVFSPAVRLANICLQVMTIIAASYAAWWTWYGVAGGKLEVPHSTTFLLFGTLVIVAVAFAILTDLIFNRDLLALARKSNVAPQLAAIWPCMGLGCAFAAKLIDHAAALPTPWLIYWLSFTTAGVLCTHSGLRSLARLWDKEGRLTHRTALIGGGEHGARYIEWLGRNQERTPDIELVGYYDDRRRRVPTELGGIKYKGSVNDLLTELLRGSVDQVFIALPWTADCRIEEIAQQLRRVSVDVRLVPESIAFRLADKSNSTLNQAMLEVVRRPIKGWNLLAKELFDKVVAGLLLLMFMPIMLLIAIAIKINDPGPVLFRQHRVGFNNRPINVWKFRTMYHDRCENENIKQAQVRDPRVTRVGYWLRRLSLDELPQLANVLAGEMSIVGPRPHAPSTLAAGRFFDEVIDTYATRHTVKPGITGWAQVNGWRGPTDTEAKLIKRVECDLYYIENWSVAFDVLILLRTLAVSIKGANAL